VCATEPTLKLLQDHSPEAGPQPELVNPTNDPRWHDLVESGGGFYSSPPWLSALADGYRLRPQGLLLSEAGSPAAGVAFCSIKDGKGRRTSALPFSDAGDPLGLATPERAAELLGPLLEPGVPFSIRVADSLVPSVANAGLGLLEQGRLAWHRAELPETGEELWSQIASGARQNIRKARKADLEIEVGNDVATLLAFRDLHVSLRKRKYSMLAQPTGFFEAIGKHFGTEGLRVVLARLDGVPVAGVVLLRFAGIATYKFNASTEQANRIRANDLVMWHSLVEAVGWGCQTFDFGVSDLDQPGLIRYKRKYATDEAAIVSLSNGVTLDTRRARSFDAVLPKLTKALTSERCPTALTSRGGDLLYRYFC